MKGNDVGEAQNRSQPRQEKGRPGRIPIGPHVNASPFAQRVDRDVGKLELQEAERRNEHAEVNHRDEPAPRHGELEGTLAPAQVQQVRIALGSFVCWWCAMWKTR